jgi:hypothetical protein
MTIPSTILFLKTFSGQWLLAILRSICKMIITMLWSFTHILLHVAVPITLARVAFADRWKRPALIMVLTMVVDLDHLLADPLFDPLRCSIGFHPLHSYPAIAAYLLMLALPRLRFVALGLLIHMGIDGTECIRLALH